VAGGAIVAFCQKCGSAIEEEASFCGKCGVPVASPSSPLPAVAVPVQVHRRSPLKVLLWAGAGFFALIIMLGLIIAAGGKGSSQISDVAAIQAVRQQDADLAAAMTSAIHGIKVSGDDDLDRIGGLIKDYVGHARHIDTHSCPRDFAESYYRNISAWSDEADAILAHPHIPQTQTEAFVDGFFRGLAGDITGGQAEIGEWFRDLKAKDAEVGRTQEEVNAVAVRYGAR
jgi:hypothetical protein